MDELIENSPDKIEELMQAIRMALAVDPWKFARMTGTSEGAINRAWKQGVLPCMAGGNIPMREGIVALVSVGGFRRKKKLPQFLIDADILARSLLGLPDRDYADSDEDNASEIRAWKLRYLQAQTAARAAMAAQKQRENEIQRGLLVKTEDVTLDASETAANVARVFDRLPERVAGMCVGLSAEAIALVIRKEIILAFDAIQKSAFTGDWGYYE
jgi:phage terminase Nu1 subunit (DNA packaging protein)